MHNAIQSNPIQFVDKSNERRQPRRRGDEMDGGIDGTRRNRTSSKGGKKCEQGGGGREGSSQASDAKLKTEIGVESVRKGNECANLEVRKTTNERVATTQIRPTQQSARTKLIENNFC